MLKPFDLQTYDANDDAKHDIIKMFRQNFNCTIGVNADKYGIDLVGRFNDGTLFGVEVEVKHNWQSEHFMFESVHYAARKTKFIDAFPETYFCTVNAPRTHCLLINMQTIDSMRMVRKQTTMTTKEWFLEVATHLFDIYTLDN